MSRPKKLIRELGNLLGKHKEQSLYAAVTSVSVAIMHGFLSFKSKLLAIPVDATSSTSRAVILEAQALARPELMQKAIVQSIIIALILFPIMVLFRFAYDLDISIVQHLKKRMRATKKGNKADQ